MTAPVRCEDCHRPLKTPDSKARGRGPVCQAVLEGDTHIAPKARRPARRKRLPEDQPITGFPAPKGQSMSDTETARGRIADALDRYQLNWTRLTECGTDRATMDSAIPNLIHFFAYAYLLEVLRRYDEQLADQCSRWLESALIDAGDAAEWVWQWREDIAAGHPLTLPDLAA